MEPISLMNISVVVVAEQHNPTILHPSFLYGQKIVPGEWKIVEGPICTPAFSLVGFDGGISFRVEQSKLQIVDTAPHGDGSDSVVSTLAKAYVEKLPHVHYKAVGVNFAAFSICENCSNYMVERFLKSGPWNGEELKPLAAGVHLTYQLDNATLNLSLRPGYRQDSEGHDSSAGIVLEGNCHTDTSDTSQVLEAVAGFRDKIVEAFQVCAKVLDTH